MGSVVDTGSKVPTPWLMAAMCAVHDGTELGTLKMLKAAGAGDISGDSLRRWANIGRSRSRDRCNSCCGDTPKVWRSKKKIALKDLPLCGCLWVMRYTYVEHVVGWVNKQADIVQQYERKELKPESLIYSDVCSDKECGKVFGISAQVFYGTIAKYGSHRRIYNCLECSRKRQVQRDKQKQDRIARQASHTPSHGAKLRKKSYSPMKTNAGATNAHEATIPLMAPLEAFITAKKAALP